MGRVLLAALLLKACGAEPHTYAAPGDATYRAATICTTAALAPFVQDAVRRWHDASDEVNQTVRVVDSPESEPDGCDVNVYTDPDVSKLGDDGFSRPGLILVDDGDEFMSDASDVLAHEDGHLLIGGMNDEAHSTDPTSVMFGREQAGEQAITADDVAKIGKFAR